MIVTNYYYWTYDRTVVAYNTALTWQGFNPLRGLGPRRTYGLETPNVMAEFQSAPRLGAAENGLGICVLLGSTRNYR